MELLINAQSLILTNHALQRMSAREISRDDVRRVFQFGTRSKQEDGSMHVVMDFDALDRASDGFFVPYKLYGIVLVVKDGNILVTAYRDFKTAETA